MCNIHMFNSCKNSKKQGDLGLGCAIAHFTQLGYTVSLPITDSQDYDLIIDNNDKICRVQVKTTKYKPKNQNDYIVNLRVMGGNRSFHTEKKFDNSKVEIIFVLTEDGSKYIIPSDKIVTKTNLQLGKNMSIFKI